MRAPSTLGTFLRAFTFGHVRQLDAIAAGLVANLAHLTPLLPGVGTLAYLDADDTVKAKQGAGHGYSGVKGLNALVATLSTPLAAPVSAQHSEGSAGTARAGVMYVVSAIDQARVAAWLWGYGDGWCR